MGVASVHPLQPSEDHRQNAERSRRRRRHRSADAGDNRVFWCAVVPGESADRASERARDHAWPSLGRLHVLLLRLPLQEENEIVVKPPPPAASTVLQGQPVRCFRRLRHAPMHGPEGARKTRWHPPGGRGAACSSCTACRLSFVRRSVMLPRWRLGDLKANLVKVRRPSSKSLEGQPC